MKKSNTDKVNVSIIVPIYNSEKYLLMTINSLVSQTLENVEIIMANSGPSDNSR